MALPIDILVCKFDGSQHDSLEALHAHIRKFKIKRAAYYEEYYPRKDKFSGRTIRFKDVDQYFTQEFESKESLRKWLGANKESGKQWAAKWLVERKEKKDLVYAPSQVELESSFCPSMRYYDGLFGDYYELTTSMGYRPRFEPSKDVITANLSVSKVIIDTREQNPLNLPLPTIRQKLNCGDYGLVGPEDRHVYIERKEIGDFAGTLSPKGLVRFEKEIIRAVKSKSYLIMVVEDDIDTCLTFNELPYMRHTKASPSYIFHNLRTLLAKYPLNFQALFVSDRKEMSRVIIKLLGLGEKVKTIDLQYAYEKKLL
jgi:hypothetical protein